MYKLVCTKCGVGEPILGKGICAICEIYKTEGALIEVKKGDVIKLRNLGEVLITKIKNNKVWVEIKDIEAKFTTKTIMELLEETNV